MNPSAEPRAVVILRTQPAVRTDRWRGAVVMAALAGYPALKFGLALRTTYAVLALATLVAAYGLAICLYQGIARQVSEGRMWRVIVSGAIGLAAGLTLCTPEYHVMMLSETIMILATGITVGWRLRAGDSGLRVYALGTLLVLAGGIAMFASYWGQLMTVFETVGRESADTFAQTLSTLGYHPDAAAAYGTQLEKVVQSVARLIPAATVMNLVAQFSIGFLWLLWRGSSTLRPSGLLAPFTRWKVPFTLTPVLIIAALGRLLGGAIITLAADNLLLALSIYYCVGGLALVDFTLRRLRMPLGARILFYIVLTLTGLVGYALTVLLGFIDSFADWRRVSSQSIELNES